LAFGHGTAKFLQEVIPLFAAQDYRTLRQPSASSNSHIQLRGLHLEPLKVGLDGTLKTRLPPHHAHLVDQLTATSEPHVFLRLLNQRLVLQVPNPLSNPVRPT